MKSKKDIFCLEDIAEFLVKRRKTDGNNSVEVLKELILDIEQFNVKGKSKKQVVIKAMDMIFGTAVSAEDLNQLIDTMVTLLNTTIKRKKCF